MKRKLIIKPAWNKREPDPSKDYGVHGVEMRWYVIGDEGAVHFVLYTGWLLPDDTTSFFRGNVAHPPLPADIGYHSHTPMYERQGSMKCDILKGDCYYDGSSLMADKYFKILVKFGGEKLFEALTEYYKHIFKEVMTDDKKRPNA